MLMEAEDVDARVRKSIERNRTASIEANAARSRSVRATLAAKSGNGMGTVERGRDGEFIVTAPDGTRRIVKL